jgi:predicted RNase H-like nuclease
MKERSHLVAGIDGYGRGAWIAVVLDRGRFHRALPGRSLDDLLPQLQECAVLAIDIPIGLPDSGPRHADQLSYALLGPRRSSVFPTPPRAVLEAGSFEAANAIARESLGRGISLQAYGLRSRILEAERQIRAGRNLIEVHPEVSFATLAGQPLAWSMSSWRGAPLRRSLLDNAGIVLPADLGPANHVPVPDILDAAVAAWSAQRFAYGLHTSLPNPPMVYSDGLPSAIRA